MSAISKKRTIVKKTVIKSKKTTATKARRVTKEELEKITKKTYRYSNAKATQSDDDKPAIKTTTTSFSSTKRGYPCDRSQEDRKKKGEKKKKSVTSLQKQGVPTARVIPEAILEKVYEYTDGIVDGTIHTSLKGDYEKRTNFERIMEWRLAMVDNDADMDVMSANLIRRYKPRGVRMGFILDVLLENALVELWVQEKQFKNREEATEHIDEVSKKEVDTRELINNLSIPRSEKTKKKAEEAVTAMIAMSDE